MPTFSGLHNQSMRIPEYEGYKLGVPDNNGEHTTEGICVWRETIQGPKNPEQRPGSEEGHPQRLHLAHSRTGVGAGMFP